MWRSCHCGQLRSAIAYMLSRSPHGKYVCKVGQAPIGEFLADLIIYYSAIFAVVLFFFCSD